MKTKPLVLGTALFAGVITAGYIYQLRRPQQSNPVPTVQEAVLRSEKETSKVSQAGLASDGKLSTDFRSSPAVAIALDENNLYQERKDAISQFPLQLSQADLQNIREFLSRSSSSDREQAGQVFKNELFNHLCRIKPASADVGDLFVQTFRDKNQDQVIRDYAVQHLAALYENADSRNRNNPDLHRLVESTLWEALSETENSIAGTALLGLARLAETNDEFDSVRIAKAALQMSQDGQVGELSRIAAYQVCGRMKLAAAEPVLFQAALNGETISLRISAIGALGQLGDSEAKALLINLLNGNEERLKYPARQALLRIQSREDQSKSVFKKEI